MIKRNLHIVVLSNIHLGAYTCHTEKLLNYLEGIAPEVLILNGGFVDPFTRDIKSIPKSHKKIINKITSFAQGQTKVFYIVPDKEEALKMFPEFAVLGINIRSELVLQLNGNKHWFFPAPHSFADTKGSLFKTLTYYRYRFFVNAIKVFRAGSVSNHSNAIYIDKLNDKTKDTVPLVEEFEQSIVKLAAQKGYDTVVCGQTHKPAIKEIENSGQVIQYLNPGDWLAGLTALEYRFGKWHIYEYDDLDYNTVNPKLRVRSKNTKRAKPDTALAVDSSSNDSIKTAIPNSKKLKSSTN